MAVDKVPIQTLEYPGDGLHYKAGVPFTGVAITRDTHGGWIQAEEEFKDGLVCGIVRTWHALDVLATEEVCAWGVRHGDYREWSESAKLVAEGRYQYGIRVAEKRWDEDGNLVEDYQLKESDPDFKTLSLAKEAYGDQP
jgi:antitoxin component YwqK of YwqJK toxin-antitoxin module